MITEHHEIQAWLGDNHGLADEQIDQLRRTADDIADRYPDADDANERHAALTVAYRLMVEEPESVVYDLAGDLARARASEERALAAVRQAALTLVRIDGGKGARGVETQAGFAQRMGIDRLTVRDWLGLRPNGRRSR